MAALCKKTLLVLLQRCDEIAPATGMHMKLDHCVKLISYHCKCGQSFKDKVKLTQHIANHSLLRKLTKREKCVATLIHAEAKYFCVACGVFFKHKVALKDHAQKHLHHLQYIRAVCDCLNTSIKNNREVRKYFREFKKRDSAAFDALRYNALCRVTSDSKPISKTLSPCVIDDIKIEMLDATLKQNCVREKANAASNSRPPYEKLAESMTSCVSKCKDGSRSSRSVNLNGCTKDTAANPLPCEEYSKEVCRRVIPYCSSKESSNRAKKLKKELLDASTSRAVENNAEEVNTVPCTPYQWKLIPCAKSVGSSKCPTREDNVVNAAQLKELKQQTGTRRRQDRLNQNGNPNNTSNISTENGPLTSKQQAENEKHCLTRSCNLTQKYCKIGMSKSPSALSTTKFDKFRKSDGTYARELSKISTSNVGGIKTEMFYSPKIPLKSYTINCMPPPRERMAKPATESFAPKGLGTSLPHCFNYYPASVSRNGSTNADKKDIAVNLQTSKKHETAVYGSLIPICVPHRTGNGAKQYKNALFGSSLPKCTNSYATAHGAVSELKLKKEVASTSYCVPSKYSEQDDVLAVVCSETVSSTTVVQGENSVGSTNSTNTVPKETVNLSLFGEKQAVNKNQHFTSSFNVVQNSHQLGRPKSFITTNCENFIKSDCTFSAKTIKTESFNLMPNSEQTGRPLSPKSLISVIGDKFCESDLNFVGKSTNISTVTPGINSIAKVNLTGNINITQNSSQIGRPKSPRSLLSASHNTPTNSVQFFKSEHSFEEKLSTEITNVPWQSDNFDVNSSFATNKHDTVTGFQHPLVLTSMNSVLCSQDAITVSSQNELVTKKLNPFLEAELEGSVGLNSRNEIAITENETERYNPTLVSEDNTSMSRSKNCCPIFEPASTMDSIVNEPRVDITKTGSETKRGTQILKLEDATSTLGCANCCPILEPVSTMYHTEWETKQDEEANMLDSENCCPVLERMDTIIHQSQLKMANNESEAKWDGLTGMSDSENFCPLLEQMITSVNQTQGMIANNDSKTKWDGLTNVSGSENCCPLFEQANTMDANISQFQANTANNRSETKWDSAMLRLEGLKNMAIRENFCNVLDPTNTKGTSVNGSLVKVEAANLRNETDKLFANAVQPTTIRYADLNSDADCETNITMNNHECTECSIAFEDQDDLEEHLYTHADQKCYVCGFKLCNVIDGNGCVRHKHTNRDEKGVTKNIEHQYCLQHHIIANAVLFLQPESKTACNSSVPSKNIVLVGSGGNSAIRECLKQKLT